MKRKIGWLILSSLMVLSLVLASCGPAVVEEGEVVEEEAAEEEAVEEEAVEEKAVEEEAVEEEAVEEEEGPEMVTITLTKTDGTPVTLTKEKPRYGGTLRYSVNVLNMGYDPIYAYNYESFANVLVFEEMFQADWQYSLDGTGEYSFKYDMLPLDKFTRPMLAESWELTTPTTLTFNIRKGIRFHNKPPTNGREMTAEDIAFCINRIYFDETSRMFYTTTKPLSVTCPDKWTLVIECPEGMAALMFSNLTGNWGQMYSPDQIEEYGDMKDWRNQCGTGPFILVDAVEGSSLTLERNPNYWGKHPVYGDQMPYLDKVKVMIIQDESTKLAALRTGKLDIQDYVPWMDAENLMRANPQLKSSESIKNASVYMFFIRNDTPPFDDIRVRRAMWMAIDRETIINDYYGGHAHTFGFPVLPIPAQADWYVPVEELSESAQELFTYNPEESKRLLAEAGYPSGFQCSVETTASFVDEISIFKDYLAAVDIDLEIRVNEYAVWWSLLRARSFENMLYCYRGWGDAAAAWGSNWIKDARGTNCCMVDCSKSEEAYKAYYAAWPDEKEQNRIAREFGPWAVEQARELQNVAVYCFTMWWPWVKGYHGEWATNKYKDWSYAPFVWVDQELKESMGY